MTTSWRDLVLREFVPQVHPIILVTDADHIVTEEYMLEEIEKRGFSIVMYNDPIEMRFVMETKYRASWDEQSLQDLVIIGTSAANHFEIFPYDLLAVGYTVSFGLSDIFPYLDYGVVRTLASQHWNSLYIAQHKERLSVRLSASDTADFVLRHVFHVAPETVTTAHDLLNLLLKHHYGEKKLPPPIERYLVRTLRQRHEFADWPVESLIPDRAAFFDFLQERWSVFLDSLAEASGAATSSEKTTTSISPPLLLPFDHEAVRVYVDNLFTERLLQPIPHPQSNILRVRGTWVELGLVIHPQADLLRRVERLLGSLKDTIPYAEDSYGTWLDFAQRWAILNVEMNDLTVTSDKIKQSFREIQAEVDRNFSEWLQARYSSLYNQPPSPPVMVHHIPKHLARWLSEAPDKKIALVVVDGMSLSQWQIIKKALQTANPNWLFDEHTTFAWIPTMTSISRQAIFSGKLPYLFESHISTTANEAKYWRQFWMDEGIPAKRIAYAKSLNDDNFEQLGSILSDSRNCVLGLVVDTVDKIMHGEHLGTSGMQSHVRQWVEKGLLTRLVFDLLTNGFAVWITADHGNTEAVGIGRPEHEGVLADQKAERVRIYSERELRSRFAESVQGAVEWTDFGLPRSMFCLFSGERSAFTSKGTKTMTHGGITIDEVIVPFVSISEK